jgi:hypothetical protein
MSTSILRMTPGTATAQGLPAGRVRFYIAEDGLPRTIDHLGNVKTPRGERGESPYQTAVRHGFQGSEADWLASQQNAAANAAAAAAIASAKAAEAAANVGKLVVLVSQTDHTATFAFGTSVEVSETPTTVKIKFP